MKLNSLTNLNRILVHVGKSTKLLNFFIKVKNI